MKTIQLQDALKKHKSCQEKIISPRETLEKFYHRLGETGLDIFEEAVRVDTGRLGIPVYFSMYGKSARELTGLRKQMGKGATEDQAKASAVMELVERYSLYSFKNNGLNFQYTSFNELTQNPLFLDEIAKSVGDNSAETQKALSFFANYRQHWCRGIDLSDNREVLLPFSWFFMINEFNGASAGNCLEEAICQGLCEVVERHVSDIVSEKMPPLPGVDIKDLMDPVALDLLNKYHQAGIKIHINDFSLDTGIPTIGVIAYDPDTLGKTSEIVWTAGTTTDPVTALNRTLTEIAQLAGDFHSGSVYEASGLPKPESLSELETLMNPEKIIPIQDIPGLAHNNIRIEIGNLTAALKKSGFSAYGVETTDERLNIPACYTMAPGTGFRERARQKSVAMFLARMITDSETPERALSMIRDMDRELPGKYYLSFYKGTIFLSGGNTGEAFRFFKKALEEKPSEDDRTSILVYAGLALKEEGEYLQALDYLNQAVERDSERTDSHNLAGFCYFALKEHEKAIKEFKKVVELNPSSAIDWASIAANYRDLGNREEAILHYEKALAIDPSITYARENLEKLKKSS